MGQEEAFDSAVKRHHLQGLVGFESRDKYRRPGNHPAIERNLSGGRSNVTRQYIGERFTKMDLLCVSLHTVFGLPWLFASSALSGLIRFGQPLEICPAGKTPHGDSMVTEGPAVDSYTSSPTARRMEVEEFSDEAQHAEEKIIRRVTHCITPLTALKSS